MRTCSGHGVLALALLALHAAAQEQDLAAVLAGFPDDGMPRLLSQLGTAQHEEAVKALRVIGRTAHPYLLGAVRGWSGVWKDVVPAFGNFGPDCTESLPLLMVLVKEPLGSMTAMPLLRALGPAARPAVPVLQKLKDAAGKQLAAQLLEGPPAPAARARVAPVVEGRWREDLLAILKVPGERARWWRALQALLAIDEAAVADATALLAAHALLSEDAAVRSAAREVLTAIRLRHVGTAMTDVSEIAALPHALMVTELRRHVLAQRLRPYEVRPPESVAAALCGHAEREVRFLMVLKALLQDIPPVPATRTAPMQLPLSTWLADADEGVRQLARTLERARSASVAGVEPAGGSNQDARLMDLSRLGDDQLRLLPVEQVRDLLARADKAPPVPREQVKGNVAEDLLRIAAQQPSGISNHLAQVVLHRLVAADAALLTRLGELSAEERRTLFTACMGSRGGAPELHGWVLDQIELLPPEKQSFDRPMPIELLPALRSRLLEGKDLERTVALWRQACSFKNWADAAEESVEALAALMPRLSTEGCQRVVMVLRVAGARGRRELERLTLDASVPAAARAEIVKRLTAGAQTTPPSGAFVIKLLEHEDAELRSRGVSLAQYVREDRAAVGAVLLKQWPAADAKQRASLAFALGRLQVAEAVPLLTAELEQREGAERIQVAVSLLDIEESNAAAIAALNAFLDGADDELQKTAWHRISHSPGASARFLERAVANLDKGGQPDGSFREFRLIQSAMARRRDEAMGHLTRLQRHRDQQVAEEARQTLERLEREKVR